MKNTAKNISFLVSTVILFLIVCFTAIPITANADCNYYDGYSYRSCGSYGYNYNVNSLIGNQYSYGRTTSVSYSTPISVPVYYPVYTPVYTVAYPTLQASCFARTSNNAYNNSNLSVLTGDTVTWYAYVSGGTGSYSYSWSGTDNLYGYASAIYKSYYNIGTKSAVLSVTSGNQVTTVNCGNLVNVYEIVYPQPQIIPVSVPVPIQVQVPTIQYPAYQMNLNTGLDIGCFVDPTTASINQPVTWSVEVTGGRAPYTYSWTGSDSLVGTISSIIKYYGTSGVKSAIVTVTSADGKTGVKACSNTVTVRAPSTNIGYSNPIINTQPVTKTQPVIDSTQSVVQQTQSNQQSTQSSMVKAQTQDSNNSQTANVPTSAMSLFSLSNIPWGWVGILVILVLFATVMYLLFNRPKI